MAVYEAEGIAIGRHDGRLIIAPTSLCAFSSAPVGAATCRPFPPFSPKGKWPTPQGGTNQTFLKMEEPPYESH